MRSEGAGIRLEPGVVVGGRFALRRPIGEGGMGWVWEAVEVATNEAVALKLLKSAREDDRRRFLREMRAAAAVSHPNVVAIREVVEIEDDAIVCDAHDTPSRRSVSLAMVMELLDGDTLGAVLEREGRLELPVAAAILLDVVAALEAAHAAGIVHRDLKPDNIFLARPASQGGMLGVRVLDFGVAKLTASEGLAARTEALTGTGSMVGTPFYMSPEQVESEKDLDARADIWSLGIVLYECLAGRRPTEADTVGRVLKRILMADFAPIGEHCEGLPADVEALVGRMLVGPRDERLKDLAEVAEVLRRHAASSIPMLLPSTRLPTDEAFAQTVRAPTPAELAPRSRPERANDVAAGRGDTHAAVAVASDGARARSRARARTRAVVAVGGLAVALAGLGVWRVGFATTATSAASASVAGATPPPPAMSAPTSPTESTSAAAPVVATASPSASAMASASASAKASAMASASASASASVPVVTAPSFTAPRCAANEVLSKGHCCARGLEWQGKQCERPLATKF